MAQHGNAHGFSCLPRLQIAQDIRRWSMARAEDDCRRSEPSLVTVIVHNKDDAHLELELFLCVRHRAVLAMFMSTRKDRLITRHEGDAGSMDNGLLPVHPTRHFIPRRLWTLTLFIA